ncbi:MAG: tyrosine-type recombinase/integrase [Pseudomonadota bacterium]
MPRKEKLPANVSSFVDRHGKRRYRWRKCGRQRYFVAHPNSPEGGDELQAFLADTQAPAIVQASHGTVAWAAQRYFASATFRGGKNAQTERTARLILDKFVGDYGKYRIADWRFDHIEAVLMQAAAKRPNDKGRMIGGPSAANNLRRELKTFFDYAIKLLRIERTNPVDQAAPIAVPRRGFHTWTEDEIEKFRAHWAVGTKARLALEIFLWTAQRRGDASRFGRKHLVNGRIEVTPEKTSNSSGVTVWLPAAPQLLDAIAKMPVTGTETYLVTDYGKPFTVAGLGNKMREWCNNAGLPHCSAHGLRKATSRRSAESGATNQELKALGGWTTDRQVAVYTENANRQTLAEKAMNPVIQLDLANRKSRDLANRTKKPQKS